MSVDKYLISVFENRLFKNILRQDIEFEFNSKNLKEFAEDEIVYQLGDKSESIYLILSGKVIIKFHGSSRSTSLILNIGKNDFFGHNEILTSVDRKSTALVSEKSMIYKINISDLKRLYNNKTLRKNLYGFEPDETLELEDELNILAVSEHGERIELPSETTPKGTFQTNESEENRINNVLKDNFEIKDTNSIIEEIQNNLDKYQSNIVDDALPTQHSVNENARLLQNNINIENEKEKPSQEQIFLTNNSPDQTIELKTEKTSQEKDIEHTAGKGKITEIIFNGIESHLKVIVNSADELMQFSLSPEAQTILKRIIDESNSIINSLKVQSNEFNDNLHLNAQVIYATTVFDDILNLLTGYTEFRGISLLKKFEADASISVDKNLLYHACLEIVKFLCEKLSNQGSISSVLTRTRDTIIMNFTSTALKITDDFFTNIFEHADSSSDIPTLNTALRIIKKHNGFIKAERSTESTPEIKIILPIVQ